MATQTLKDSRNSTTGYIETQTNGTQVGKDTLHRIVGYYDPKTNKTKDASHRNVGEGNLLSSLITAARYIMNEQWYYSRGGKQAGPVPGAELKQLASSGQLSTTDMVWKEGMPNWVAAEKLKGLFAAPAGSVPPPLPSPPAPLVSAPPPVPSSRVVVSNSNEAAKLQSTAQTLGVLYGVLFGISMLIIILQAVTLGFTRGTILLWAVTLGGAVACRFYRTSIVNRRNRLISISGVGPMI